MHCEWIAASWTKTATVTITHRRYAQCALFTVRVGTLRQEPDLRLPRPASSYLVAAAVRPDAARRGREKVLLGSVGQGAHAARWRAAAQSPTRGAWRPRTLPIALP